MKKLVTYHIQFILAIIIISTANAQSRNDTLYTDFDLVNFKPRIPFSPSDSNNCFVRYHYNKSGKQEGFEFINRFSEKNYSRFATIVERPYGTVLAFNTEKTPGYEKVIIFGDWDYLK